jgi:ketosteroid isomerase-like protein
MKRIAFAVSVAVLVCGVAVLAKTQTGSAEQEIIKLENEWGDALIKHDPAPIDKMLADDFIGTTGEGAVYTKAQLLANVKSGKEDIISMVDDEVKVHVYGDAAVISARNTIKVRVEGKETIFLDRYTDTWIKRDGRWKCIAGHNSTIPQK